PSTLAPEKADKKTSIGQVTQIIGPVVDVEFAPGELPNIYDALKIEETDAQGNQISLTVEVQQILGDNQVRSVAMDNTDGLKRGMKALNTGAPISVPVGKPVLG